MCALAQSASTLRRKYTPRQYSKLPPGERVPALAKPGDNAFALAQQVARLRKDDKHSMADIGRLLKVSPTYAADLFLLATAASASVQRAVASGRMSATTAIDLVKAVPDRKEHLNLYILALATAKKAGERIITAKHFSIPLGKARLKPHAEAVHALKEILAETADLPDAPPDRRDTVRAVLSFLGGKYTPDDLRRFLTEQGR